MERCQDFEQDDSKDSTTGPARGITKNTYGVVFLESLNVSNMNICVEGLNLLKLCIRVYGGCVFVFMCLCPMEV